MQKWLLQNEGLGQKNQLSKEQVDKKVENGRDKIRVRARSVEKMKEKKTKVIEKFGR